MPVTGSINYEQILENLPFVSIRFLQLPNGARRIQTITENIEQLGFNKQAVLDKSVTWSEFVHPDDRLLTTRLGQTYIAKKLPKFRLDYRLVNSQGEVFWVKEYSHVTFDASGNVECIDTMLLNLANGNSEAAQSNSNISQNLVLNEILLSLQESDLSDSLKIIFDRIGEYLDVSRILLFQDSPDHKYCTLGYAWVNKDCSSIAGAKQKKLSYSYEQDAPELSQALRRAGMLIVDAKEGPESLKKSLKDDGVTSLAAFSVYQLGEHYGFISLVDYVVDRTWDAETIDLLKNISRLVSTLLMRLKNEESLVHSRKTCETVLNNIDAYIYAIDPESEEIIFANRYFRTVFGKDCIGEKGSDYIPLSPENEIKSTEQAAAVFNLPQDDGIAFHELYLERTNQWLAVSKELAPWVDSQMVYLINCYDNTVHKMYEQTIEEQAYTDYLTGLPNRLDCDESLSTLLENTKQLKQPAYLFFIDLDDFKIVNDSYGHDYGDGVLKSFAEYLKATFTGNNQVFRLGGDEFVIIIDHSNWMNVPEYLEGMLERAKSPWKALDKEFYCSLSIGVVEFISALEDARSILKKADIAMYQAKKMGKNNYAYFTDGLSEDVESRSEIEKLIRISMQDNCAGLEVFYQPYCSLGTKKITGAEALMRMRGPNNTLMLPGEFIRLAEYLGLIVPMGEHVLRKAAELCKQINDTVQADFSICVNFSLAQFKQESIISDIKRVLRETGVNLQNIIIGIDEVVALEDNQDILNRCEELRQNGVRVALDDFGSGMASFINMRKLPVDIIKVSPMYLYDYEDKFTRRFLELMVELGHFSSKEICMTNVETDEQFDFCRELNGDIVQGFLLHRPDTAENLLKLLQ